jgi:predicted MarR family transcription regulator
MTKEKKQRAGSGTTMPQFPKGPSMRPPSAEEIERLENALTGFEWALWRLSSAFVRWQGECMTAVAEKPLNGHETALLHVIAHQKKAKGLSEIGRLLGRDDIANVQYAIRKLLKLGLIERVEGRSRKETIYRASVRGIALTQRYRLLRRKLLISLLSHVKSGDTTLRQLAGHSDVITAFYDNATRRAATDRS